MALTKMVDGVEVQLTPQEEADMLAMWAAQQAIYDAAQAQWLADAPLRAIEADLLLRKEKLDAVIIYMRKELAVSNTEFAKFVVDSRLSRDDYANGTDAFVTWVNNTFPTKTYYILERKNYILNILSQ